MAGFNIGQQQKNKKIVGEIRKSKLTYSAGCGALVEFSGFSGIMAGQNLWEMQGTKHMRIHEKVLEDFLGRDYFLQVSSRQGDKYGRQENYQVPVMRFPEMYFCPSCHELDYARRLARNYADNKNVAEPLLCARCKNIELIPSRFVLACSDGHIEDFPYKWWVHMGDECPNARLSLEYKGSTGGLDSIEIKCLTCNKSRTMANVLNKESTVSLKCKGNMPWLGRDKKCECGKPLRTLLRGASNIYYPETISALTIPPWSNAVQKAIADDLDTFKTIFVNGVPEEALKAITNNYYDSNDIEKRIGCTKEEFYKQLSLRFSESGNTEESHYNLKIDEYKAFVGIDMDDDYFKTETVEIADEIKPYFRKIKKVKRLRQVNVLKSFRRIDAYGTEEGKSAQLSDKKEKWLPATETLGEGIFIEFSSEMIQKWQASVSNRYEKMRTRYNSNYMPQRYGTFSPIMVMIHTFSHLIMREFSYSCGYDAASLSEKIYVSDDTDAVPMAGLLIYTTSSCSDGSLGGLVRLGDTKRFKEAIFSMLDKAVWCSNDPICVETEDQGTLGVNYAACHACALVPEISCEFGNYVLDRCSIVGKPENVRLGYFGGLVE